MQSIRKWRRVRLPQSDPGGVSTPEPGAGTDSLKSPEPDNPLLGGWSATRWQYTNSGGRSLDVVCDLGGSVSLSLSATAFILAYDLAGRPGPGVSGTFRVRGDELLLAPHGAAGPESVRFQQSGPTLSLYSNASGWDFDGDGKDEAAEFVAVLVRL